MNFERLKEIRKSKKITLSEMGKRCGVSRETVGNMENGVSRVSIGVLESYASALGMEVRVIYRDL